VFDLYILSEVVNTAPLSPSDATPQGGRLQIGMAEIKSESVADFIPESVADFTREKMNEGSARSRVGDVVHRARWGAGLHRSLIERSRGSRFAAYGD
jgi:hypothetical protein